MYDIVGGNICYESKYALVKDGKTTLMLSCHFSCGNKTFQAPSMSCLKSDFAC